MIRDWISIIPGPQQARMIRKLNRIVSVAEYPHKTITMDDSLECPRVENRLLPPSGAPVFKASATGNLNG
jgi:hypothetical protein